MILSYFLKWLFCLVSFCLDKETARATARFGKLHIQQEKGAAPNGSRMVVFSTARNLTTLAVAEHLNWIGDGTFYVAPQLHLCESVEHEYRGAVFCSSCLYDENKTLNNMMTNCAPRTDNCAPVISLIT